MQSAYIYGKNAVMELIKKHPERVQGVFVSFAAEKEFAPICRAQHIRVEPLAEHDFRRELEGVVHQGVVAKVAMEGLVLDYETFIRSFSADASTCLVLLNEVTDPHNVGAIVRSAAAFGATAVLIPTHNQAPITGSVAKASAGMVFSVPIVAINNENQTIEDLKKRKFWVYGLAGEGSNDIHKEKFDAPAVFVVGSEGEGLRAKTREHCDILLRIPMHPRAESLNASVSAAVVLAEWSKQHPEALKG
jgi:23S rRNA (guanosine2251-2'-O)-methyltransferase